MSSCSTLPVDGGTMLPYSNVLGPRGRSYSCSCVLGLEVESYLVQLFLSMDAIQ